MKRFVFPPAVLALVLAVLPLNLQAQEEEVADAVVADAVVEEAESSPVADAARPLTVAVELYTSTTIAGTLVDNAQVSIKSAFGEAKIPMSQVAGIRFASAEDATTTVVMLNGDSITGATTINTVTVDTEWGQAKINGSAVQSLMLVPDLRWNATQSINGRRWNLVEATQANTPRPQTPQRNAQPNTTTRRGVVQPNGTVVYPSGQ